MFFLLYYVGNFKRFDRVPTNKTEDWSSGFWILFFRTYEKGRAALFISSYKLVTQGQASNCLLFCPLKGLFIPWKANLQTQRSCSSKQLVKWQRYSLPPNSFVAWQAVSAFIIALLWTLVLHQGLLFALVQRSNFCFKTFFWVVSEAWNTTTWENASLYSQYNNGYCHRV